MKSAMQKPIPPSHFTAKSLPYVVPMTKNGLPVLTDGRLEAMTSELVNSIEDVN